MRTRSGTIPAVAAAAVLALALAGCGDQQAGSGDGGPPPLAIGSPTTGGAVAADSAGSRSDAGGYTLDGPLPDGPASAVVLRYADDAVDADQVGALAMAVGLTGEPTRAAHGWELTGPAGLLRVRDDGEWSFSRVGLPCPSYAVDVTSPDGGGGVSCASAEPDQPVEAPVVTDLGTVEDQGSIPPVDADALAAAQPLLAAAGVDGEPRVQSWPGSSTASVLVDPTVAGLPTSGIRTTVDVDDAGVVGAMGRLGEPVEGPAYPILSAQQTFDRLAAMPVPLPAIACPESVDGRPDPCPTPTPVSVVGAALGLALAYEAGDPVLVPAWLFDVAGSDEPVAMIAVVDEYLTDPTGGDDPTSGSGSSGSEPGSGGATDTPVAPPSDPGLSPEPVPGGEPLSAPVERAILEGRTLTLVGWGGACADYAAIADESADAVKVQIVGKPTVGPDQACIEIAVELRLAVTLDAPLGDRDVVDATTGATVPVTR